MPVRGLLIYCNWKAVNENFAFIMIEEIDVLIFEKPRKFVYKREKLRC